MWLSAKSNIKCQLPVISILIWVLITNRISDSESWLLGPKSRSMSFCLKNVSCCHWSVCEITLNTSLITSILIEHKQKSLKSAFIWRHLNIMIHKQNSLKSIYMMAQSLTRNLSGYALFQMEISNFWGSLDSLMLCWSEVAIWHLPLRSRLHSTRALTRPAQTTQWMLYFI